MNEMAQDAWFYTKAGERAGPVGFAELKEKAAAALLDPRLDMVWKQGMEEWKSAGEIEDLFAKRSVPEPQEALAPEAGPYATPKQESSAGVPGNEVVWPGARRRSYLFMTLVFPFVWSFLLGFGAAFLAAQLGPEMAGYANLGAALIPAIAGIYFSVNRLANLGMSRWWFFGNFVPILNFWVGYRCFACPSGYAVHKKLDGPGVALAIFYWLMLALALLAVIGLIAVIVGGVNNPEVQKGLDEALRAIREGTRKP